MALRKRLLLLSLFGMICSCTVAAQLKPHLLPRIKGTVLFTGYPGYTVAITSSNRVEIVDEGTDLTATWNASISRDGTVVATGRKLLKEVTERGSAVVSVYSLTSKQWRNYTDQVAEMRAIAISPDGSKLAYAVCEHKSGNTIRLHILDASSGAELLNQQIGYSLLFSLAWSPDGQRITYDTYPVPMTNDFMYPDQQPSIYVLNLDSMNAVRIGNGKAPLWSPSGDWIAVLTKSPRVVNYNQVSLLHPDGSGTRIVITLGEKHFLLSTEQRCFGFSPVWSPDSQKLLLNELTNYDMGTYDLQLLNLPTLSMKRVAKGKAPVLAWITTE